MSEDESSVAEIPSVQAELAEAPSAPAPAEPSAPYAVFPDAESFQKRVDREARKHLKEMGVTDPSEVKSVLAEFAELKASQAEAERAKMTEIERLQSDLAQAREAAEDAEEAYDQMEIRTHLAGVFARHGIRNYDYAYFIVEQKLDSLDDGDELDEEAFVADLCNDPASKAALGLGEGAVEPSIAPRPVTTSPDAPRPPAPPQTNGAMPVKSAMDMGADEWAKHKSSLGLS